MTIMDRNIFGFLKNWWPLANQILGLSFTVIGRAVTIIHVSTNITQKVFYVNVINGDVRLMLDYPAKAGVSNSERQ